MNAHPAAPAAGRRALVVAVVALALVVVAVVVAVLLGGRTTAGTAVPVQSTGSPADREAATTRDDVVRVGGDGARIFNTLRADTFDADYDAWEAVATGELLDSLRTERTSNRERFLAAGASSTGRVLVAAAERVDADRGTATVLVALRVTVESATASSEKLVRMVATVTRTADGWRLSGITQAPIQ
ncbi:hypothetical protein L6E12_07550 [Actinokineospora sp. PR83]|uniref:hypothetical protein n=1 Tax=Actinokineospora sp. PR83 TaxID=2884908 RepID=UPI001F3C3975|nr:hypothetical protein [Actinokineospora sp. PR83]MCG8915638.1 hypothetical protein [Actinokineospora sp. PR83]